MVVNDKPVRTLDVERRRHCGEVEEGEDRVRRLEAEDKVHYVFDLLGSVVVYNASLRRGLEKWRSIISRGGATWGEKRCREDPS